jgi:hypothetical protein
MLDTWVQNQVKRSSSANVPAITAKLSAVFEHSNRDLLMKQI